MTTRTTRRVTSGRPTRDLAEELHQAVLRLVDATPVEGLERRLAELERWVARLEKDARALTSDLVMTPGRPRRVTEATRRPARRTGPARHQAPQTRRVKHLAVERELVHPGG